MGLTAAYYFICLGGGVPYESCTRWWQRRKQTLRDQYHDKQHRLAGLHSNREHEELKKYMSHAFTRPDHGLVRMDPPRHAAVSCSCFPLMLLEVLLLLLLLPLRLLLLPLHLLLLPRPWLLPLLCWYWSCHSSHASCHRCCHG